MLVNKGEMIVKNIVTLTLIHDQNQRTESRNQRLAKSKNRADHFAKLKIVILFIFILFSILRLLNSK